MKKGCLTCLLFLLSALLFARPALSFDLSAEMIAKDGESKQTGKLYVKGNKYRIEMKGGTEYAIIRHDKNMSFVILPEHKAYIEMPFDPKRKPAIEEKYPGESTRKLVGSEVVNGYATRKYHVTAKENGKTQSFYQWVATDLNFPIKTASVNGTWSIEYRNIKTSVADSIFELPENYEKIAMPPSFSEDARFR